MTSIQRAIENYEESTGSDASSSNRVMLCGQVPPIQKMDNFLSKLAACDHLGLSSNNIERITCLGRMKHLKILSIGRNQIKRLDGLEEVAGTLEQLWISYNLLDRLVGIDKLVNLKVLYMSNNFLSRWTEVDRLKACTCLEEVLMQANPIETNAKRTEDYRLQFIGRVNHVNKFDGVPIGEPERTLGFQFAVGQQLMQRFGNMTNVFKKLDVHGTGSLSKEEIADAVRNLGFPYEEAELDAFVTVADYKGDGHIHYAELCSRLTDADMVDAKG